VAGDRIDGHMIDGVGEIVLHIARPTSAPWACPA